jgi:hypothetical protein
MNQLPESHYLTLEQDSLPDSWSVSYFESLRSTMESPGGSRVGLGHKEAELLSGISYSVPKLAINFA